MKAAELEAAAHGFDAAEQEAHRRFDAVRAQGLDHEQVIETAEFHAWMAARRATDEAWGRWAMAIDAKQG